MSDSGETERMRREMGFPDDRAGDKSEQRERGATGGQADGFRRDMPEVPMFDQPPGDGLVSLHARVQPPEARSAGQIWEEFFELDPDEPRDFPMTARDKMADFMMQMPGLRFRQELARRVAERCVDVDAGALAKVAAYSEAEFVDAFRTAPTDKPEFKDIGKPGNPASVAALKLYKVVAKHCWMDDDEKAETGDSRPPLQKAREDGLLECLRPFLEAQRGLNEAAASSQKKLGKAIESMTQTKLKTKGGVEKAKDYASESSDDEGDRDAVDLGKYLDNDPGADGGVRRYIDTAWFAERRRLGKAKRHARARDDYDVPWVFTSKLSSWTPPHVHQGRTQEVQEALHKDRARRIQQNSGAFLSNLASELLNTYAIGELPLPAVLGRLLVAIRHIDERGLGYAREYYAAEKDAIAETIKIPAAMDLGAYYCREHPQISEDLRFAHPGPPFQDVVDTTGGGSKRSVRSRTPRRSDWKGAAGSGFNRGGQAEAIARDSGPAKWSDAFKSAGDGGQGQKQSAAGASAGSATGTKGQFDPSKQACFMEDARVGKSCAGRGTTCRRLHLDTMDAAGAEAFDKQMKSFKANQERKNKKQMKVKEE